MWILFKNEMKEVDLEKTDSKVKKDCASKEKLKKDNDNISISKERNVKNKNV